MPGDWRHRAACRDEDPELFFPVGTGEVAQRQTALARAVCDGCPVVVDCLAFAHQALPDGIAGGLTAAERAQQRRGRLPLRKTRSASQERRETAGRLRARGWRAPLIARELGVNERTVYRLWKSAVAS
jgi:WhiB family redox-sensing transcriptional regulator